MATHRGGDVGQGNEVAEALEGLEQQQADPLDGLVGALAGESPVAVGGGVDFREFLLRRIGFPEGIGGIAGAGQRKWLSFFHDGKVYVT